MTSAFHVYFGPEALAQTPRVRRIGPYDCFLSLKEGLDDFFAMPTYPDLRRPVLRGRRNRAIRHDLVRQRAASRVSARRRLCAHWAVRRHRPLRNEPPARTRTGGGVATDALTVVRSPALPSILAFGLLLLAIFAAWLFAAELIYVRLYGPNPPAAAIPFLHDVLSTGRGWTLDRRWRCWSASASPRSRLRSASSRSR